ncbi:hypothetical protein M2390_001039 [Mycetocola sp. BIGb0189]|uniref:hypothetical protein n=1 Tax=Mycetocola sp. BIGb0189 TaxID=2940604 RepID=UPI00216A1DA6|nr:hypothetical protein [Mycetocola sp. BIGb0189]MCS4275867.1 hypothetical protein [Mycetocola sp. BIGb0189]
MKQLWARFVSHIIQDDDAELSRLDVLDGLRPSDTAPIRLVDAPETTVSGQRR